MGQVLSKALDDIGCAAAGFQCQQDNCFREGKNQFFWAFLLLIVAIDIFRWSMVCYLKPGHSHEDIDATFGQTAGFVARNTFDDSNALVDLLDVAGRPPSQRESDTQSRSSKRHKEFLKAPLETLHGPFKEAYKLQFPSPHGTSCRLKLASLVVGRWHLGTILGPGGR